MIEQAVYEHLKAQSELTDHLTTYDGEPAVFHRKAADDADPLWTAGPQYGRVVFETDLQGDPERIMGGTLVVDVMCDRTGCHSEELEPVIKRLIHGYFFSNGTFTVAAQWKNSSYFTEKDGEVNGYTISFELLGFPIISTGTPDVIARLNEWTAANFPNLHVINYDALPSSAWKPTGEESAVYWRLVQDSPAGWIPDTAQTIWRTATIRGHIFSEDLSQASTEARDLVVALYASKRLLRAGETPIMVNRKNSQDNGADPLRTGQVTVEGTYGVVVRFGTDKTYNNINY